MRIEGIDRVIFGVRDVAQASSFFSALLDTKFDIMEPMVRGKKMTVAISPLGLELHDIAPDEEEGLRRVHFKVADIEEAKAEMEKKGIRIDAEVEIGGLKELLLNPDDCRGLRVGLIAYDVPHGSVIAIRQ